MRRQSFFFQENFGGAPCSIQKMCCLAVDKEKSRNLTAKEMLRRLIYLFPWSVVRTPQEIDREMFLRNLDNNFHEVWERFSFNVKAGNHSWPYLMRMSLWLKPKCDLGVFPSKDRMKMAKFQTLYLKKIHIC